MEGTNNKSLRISAIARELNVGADSIIDQLNLSKWYCPWNEGWTLNSKLTEEQYDWLKERFWYTSVYKDKAERFRLLRIKKQEGTLTEEERHEYLSMIPSNITNKKHSSKTVNTTKGKKKSQSKSEKWPISTSNSVHSIPTAMGNKR